MQARKTRSAGLAALALFGTGVLLGPALARADTLTTFLVFGGYLAPTEGTFSGTLTANVSAGNLTAVDITFNVIAGEYNDLSESAPSGENWEISVYDSLGDKLELTFSTIPNPGSLVNLAGGNIVSGQLLDANGVPIVHDFTGALLPSDTSGSPVPEPSWLALLVLSFLAFGLARNRLYRPKRHTHCSNSRIPPGLGPKSLNG